MGVQIPAQPLLGSRTAAWESKDLFYSCSWSRDDHANGSWRQTSFINMKETQSSIHWLSLLGANDQPVLSALRLAGKKTGQMGTDRLPTQMPLLLILSLLMF